MKRLLLLLYVAATLTLTPLILSMMAWGGGPVDVFAVFGWIGLFIAALVGLKWPSPSAIIGLASAGSIWAGLGNLLVFHPRDGILYLVLLLPSLLAVAAAGVSLWILLRGRIDRRSAGAVAIGAVVVLLGLVPALYAQRSYSQTHFAQFNLETSRGPEMAVLPQPSDTRAFIVPLTSAEVVEYVEAAAARLGGLRYLNNARLSVDYRFGSLREVTLLGFGDWRAEDPVTWTASELRGNTSFLTP